MHSQSDFFHAVLPQAGLPCLAWLTPAGPGKRRYFKHKVFDSVAEFCEAVAALDYEQFDYYFAVSTLGAKSITERGEVRIRTQTNTAYTRALILDVDLKDGFYKEVDDVVNAVNELSSSLGIPQPIVVNSGFGAHVYWPFAAGIDSKEWTSLAKQFKAHLDLIQPGLVADGTRVSDSASVLRIPDSYNLKYDQKTPVRIVQWMGDTTDITVLKRALGPVRQVKPKKAVDLTIITDSLPPAELSVVAKNCNWVSQYLKSKSAASEPEWYAALGLVPYLQHTTDGGVLDGDPIAQAFSKGHPSYDPEAATEKYRQVKERQTGPTTCERLRGINASRCEGCVFATAVKTPIQTAILAKPATGPTAVETTVVDEGGNQAVETVIIPLYPKPYFRGEDGGVFIRVKERQEDGSWEEHIEVVYDYDIYPVKRYRTELLENEIMEIHVWFPHDGLRVFKLPTSLLAEQKKLATFLAEKGVVPQHGKSLRLAKYMVDYVRYLQSKGAAEVEFGRFGWRDLKSSNPRFVVGNGYIDREGTLHPASYAYFLKDAAKAVATAGTLENWKLGFALYKEIPGSEPFILAAMMGFAAPLMAFTEYAGVLYNMVGESGAGKSTSLKVMTSIWGQPKPQHVSVKDNIIPMYNFIGYLNAVPVAMDELTNMMPEHLSDFALAFTGGRGKMRANRDGTNQQNSIEWDTIVVGTSNTSLYDKLSSNRKGYSAEAMRIYETNLPKSLDAHKIVVDRSTALLNANYGHAGREYVKYLLANKEKIQAILESTMAKITERGNLRNEERFWGAMFACVYVGGQIAKGLKLHTYDMDGLLNWALGKSDAVRESVRTSMSDPVSILSDFFNSNLDSILKFKAGRPHLGADGRALSMLRSVKVRMELDDLDIPKVAFVSTPAIRDFCASKRIDPSWFRKELISMGIIGEQNISKRLASGSGIAANSVIKCWAVDMQHERLTQTLEQLLEQEQVADGAEE